MIMASPISINDEKRSILRSSRHQTRELKPENTENGRDKSSFAGPESLDSKNVNILAECEENVLTKSGTIDMNHEVEKSAVKLVSKQKKVSPKTNGGRYPLRSSSDGGRVLLSISKSNCTTEPELANNPVSSVTKGKRKRRKVKRHLNDELAANKKRVRYLLTRMNYEQNLIDAYSGEGWKGHSAEKIRPQKELERAKSEIFRCKFKIRELFRHLDSLSSEGRFDDSLFDSEGRIDSEDIFCAKCGSKDFSSDNDIILCDGMCNRGFHQQCLNPPLLSEDIPPGDEGWLCPACKCKIDCIKFLNDFQGSHILVKDTWEKVFPEVVTIANGDKQYDDSSSDDSEDCDYDPDGPKVDVEGHKEESESDASDNNKKNSSDDEDWSASACMSTPNKGKKYINRKMYSGSSKGNLQKVENHGCQNPHSNGTNSASVSKRLGEIATQVRYENFMRFFKKTSTPHGRKKESLAQELGFAYQKVDKWFINSRHQIRVSSEIQPNIISTPIKDSGDTNIETTRIQSAKRRKSVANRKLDIGAEYRKNDGDRMNEIDKDRQKAIARELRKLKQCR